MIIKLINPNTTWSMTESCQETADLVKRPDTKVICVSPQRGPESIECYTDEYLAIPGVFDEILKGDREENVDAYIIACFGDPGLQAAREITTKPVLGIAQSAMLLSTMVAPSFSVVSILDRSYKMMEDIVVAYGMSSFCKSIRTTGLSVLSFGEDPARGMAALEAEAVRAVEEDKAESILLGCAGFVDFVADLNKRLPVPVIDGVAPAVKFAEAMVDMKIMTGKNNTYALPQQKAFPGFEDIPFVFGK